MPPLTLLTDFGTSDGYVAQMKGVILGIDAGAVIVDVSHEIPPGNIRLASLLLDQIVDAFPPRTVHVIVVDPGVGSGRQLIAIEAAGQRFVCPDNGLLTDLVARYAPARVRRLSEARFWRNPLSATFHGRDILAPVAAHWNRGTDLAEFGPPLDPANLIRLPSAEPRRAGPAWLGEVLAVDRFGNMISNLHSAIIPEERRSAIRVSIGSVTIDGINRFYAERPAGSLIALIGSSGRLEIAVNGGSAAAQLGLGIGATIHITIPENDNLPIGSETVSA
jgi:S-adenosyl-L-methionine hydrolase (adenosine-forming)